jgi:hypothetical protein
MSLKNQEDKMFDDYDYKNTSTRIKLKFIQKRDEPMYPWEIAGFLNKLNTVYYKFELLNSICSAIEHGIPPEDIFIFDHSLPLYKRYSQMNLLSEPNAAKTFYPIGMPIPLIPSKYIYEFNCFYKAFHTINSTLRKTHVQPFRTQTVASAFEVLQTEGLTAAEDYIINLAIARADKSYESAVKRGEKKNKPDHGIFEKSLEKYRKNKEYIFSSLDIILTLSDDQKSTIISPTHKGDKRLKSMLTAFFTSFDTTTRPLVCARIGNNNIRILGRSLVNKEEQTGLELKEIKRNSPLGALIEGGAALYQAINQEKRAKELHELEKKKKEEEIKLIQTQLHGEELKNFETEIKIAQTLQTIEATTDINAIRNIPDSPMKRQIEKAYSTEYAHAGRVLTEQGLTLQRNSISIDTNA